MRIFSLGDSAVTVEFGNDISSDLNSRAVTLSRIVRDDPFPGFIEAVPAYASTTVYFDAYIVRNAFPDTSAFETVSRRIEEASNRKGVTNDNFRLIEIPIAISPDFSPDLPEIATLASVSENEALEIFLSQTYRVYMLGFLPGFAYMGGVDDRIAVPRKAKPRRSVAKGSIGIAGKQTGIYPLESPGGWQIIGRTDEVMFVPDRNEPCRLSPGDNVRFIAS